MFNLSVKLTHEIHVRYITDNPMLELFVEKTVSTIPRPLGMFHADTSVFFVEDVNENRMLGKPC